VAAPIRAALLQDRSLKEELLSTIQARRELGPAYEADLVESFVDRVDVELTRRIDERVASRRRGRDGRFTRGQRYALATLILGTPVVAVAGATADLEGILASWGGIVALNLFGFLDGLRRPRD